MKTLLPRSNAVITRHWGLSHPLQIKPRTGNTQVIRGLLFCISVQCQPLAVGAKIGKRKKTTKKQKKQKTIFCAMDIGGWKTRVEPERPASTLQSVIDARQLIGETNSHRGLTFACSHAEIAPAVDLAQGL